MGELPIKRELNEDTRKQGVWTQLNGGIAVFSLHITPKGEVIITDNSDYSKIYCIMSLDYYNAVYS